MITWVSAAVLAVMMVGLWARVGHQRRHVRVKRRREGARVTLRSFATSAGAIRRQVAEKRHLAPTT